MDVIVGNPILIDTAPDAGGYGLSSPALAAIPGDGFAIAWNEADSPVGGESGAGRYFVATYGSDGEPAAAPGAVESDFATDIAVATDGTIAVTTGANGIPAIRIHDPAGNPAGPVRPLVDPPLEPGDTIVHRDLTALPDGGFAVGIDWPRDLSSSSATRNAILRFVAPDGTPVGDAVEVAQSWTFPGDGAVRLAADGASVSVAAGVGTDDYRVALWRYGDDGVLEAGPHDLRTIERDVHLSDLDRLANGDLAVAWLDRTATSGHAYNDTIMLQRLDATGTPVAPPVDVTGAERIDAAAEIVPLQDGGFVAVWSRFQTGELVYRIFDRDDVPVTGETVVFDQGTEVLVPFDAAALDDGRFVIAIQGTADGQSFVTARIFDHAPSHTPDPGGTTAFVATWQEQLAIGRGDAIDTLVTADSLPLRPFIPNLTLAGDADLNADGNDMANFLVGNDGNNILVGYLGNDVMHGHGGDDFLAMGRGNDVADTGDGQNTVWGGQGDDSIQGGADDDILNGDRHDDVIDGGAGDDSLNGGSHDDLLTGNDGDDRITGGTGADTLEGWAGADTLRGDRDDDRLVGGDGPDRFVFAALSGEDTVLDFDWTAGDPENDRIFVEVAGGTINGVAVAGVADLWARAADSLHGLRIDLGDGNAITLQGQVRSGLSQDIFELVVV